MEKIGTEITRLEILCRHYYYKGTDWILAYSEECEQYLAINRKYVKEGHLTKQLNGLEMHLSPDMDSLMKSVNDEVDLDELLASGMSKAQALCKVMDIEYRPEFEAWLS